MNDPGDDVGSVADEAAKLLGALSGWARDHGSDLGHGLHDHLADHQADHRADHQADHRADHRATGSGECTWCPICRTVHAVRRTSPEVRAHLTAAAASLVQAAAGLLATAVPPEEHRGGGVEHIDLDADGDPDEVWSEEDER